MLFFILDKFTSVSLKQISEFKNQVLNSIIDQKLRACFKFKTIYQRISSFFAKIILLIPGIHQKHKYDALRVFYTHSVL